MGRKPQTNDHSLLYERAARERDEARADAARWKAEAERLREAFKATVRHADMPDGESWEQAYNEVVDMARSALSAGGGTDA